MTSREAKAALESAGRMANVFRDACEIAVERELDYICGELRNNEPLLYRLSGYLKDDTLVALLDGRMNATVDDEDKALSRASGSRPTIGILRISWKKWDHIQKEQKLLIRFQRAAWGMGPLSTDCPEGLQIDGAPASNYKLLGSWLMLMRQKSQGRMPHWTHEEGALKSQEDLFVPCRQRAVQTKEVFEPFKDWTSTDFLKGYYEVLPNDEGIACTLLPPNGQGERRIYKVEGATEYYVKSPYEYDTDYSFKLQGQLARMSGLSDFFRQQGVTFPEMCEWQFHGLKLRSTNAADKRRRGDAASIEGGEAAGSDNTPSKGPRTSTVAHALRARLATTEAAQGTLVRSEGNADDEAVVAIPPLRRRRLSKR